MFPRWMSPDCVADGRTAEPDPTPIRSGRDQGFYQHLPVDPDELPAAQPELGIVRQAEIDRSSNAQRTARVSLPTVRLRYLGETRSYRRPRI
jgi:hypothetical protein